MSIWESLVLGLIQGFTEFLPVSSSGHLVLAQRIMGISGEIVAFDVMLHLATLIAVVAVLYKDIWALIRHPLSTPTIKLITATIPTVIIVILFKDFFLRAFSGSYLGWGFLITAVLLFIADICVNRKRICLVNREPNFAHAITMGVAQGLAILPGISRSGTTMFAGIVTGLDKSAAAKFSFLMSIPIILASSIVKLPDLKTGSIPLFPLIIGFLAAFFAAILSIKVFLALIKKHNFTGFVIYLGILGVFTLLNQYVLMLF